MKIAFVLDHVLMHYRLPFFNKLEERGYNITIFHSGELINRQDCKFQQIKVVKKNIFKIFDYREVGSLNNYDVVICMQNIRLLNLWFLTFNFFRKNKLIHWGIGTSSSKGLKSQSKFIKMVRNLFISRADAVVYYSSYPLKSLNKRFHKKSFVALNTIYNENSTDLSSYEKDSFLFIGSLNRRKGLMTLLKYFKLYLEQHNPKFINKLIIIGEGEEYEPIKSYISENALMNNVEVVGRLVDFSQKLVYFERAVASISLNQAGLAVLESFSFGVPFVSLKDAISGGEHLNIENCKNGFLLEYEKDLPSILSWFNDNKQKASELGNNAFDYYANYANMELMVDSFDKAIKYVKEN